SADAVRLSHRSTSQRRYPHCPRFCPETRTMVHREPLLVLPLVHHLVQKRVERFVPAIATNVAPAENDLRLGCLTRWRVMAEAALHAPGDADWNLAQGSVEPLLVVSLVQSRELANQRHIRRVRMLGRPFPSRSPRCSRNRKVEDGATRFI